MKEGQEKMSSDAVIPSCPPRKVLTAQKALVTGANSGIGEAIAVALGEAGADVVVNYLSGEERANEVVEEIRKTGTSAYPHRADVSQEEQVTAMFQRMFEEFGTVDILVNNAGLQGRPL
jgi:glucose 1-dehydrogenase